MQGRHGSVIHNVKDPPAACLAPRQSKIPSSHTYRTWQHAHHKHARTCRSLHTLLRRTHARRTETTCKKSLMTEGSPKSRKVVLCKRGEKTIRHEGLHAHGTISPANIQDERIHTPSETDVIEFEPTAPHFELSTRLVDHLLKAISRQQSKRTLRSFTIIPSQQKGDIAALKWLKSMSNVYGSSLMLLVGLGYWIQGFRCFPWFVVNFYLKDVLTVDPGMLQIVQNTVNIPMVAKPVYGIVSDAIYIRGAHRVPYLVIGGFLQALSWGTIAFLPGGSSSSISIVAILLALSNLGASMVDVANDALVAECAKMKKSTGELQSFAWFSTATGGVLGNLIAAFALSRSDFRFMFSMFGMLVVCQASKSMGVNEGSFGLKMPQIVDEDVEKRTEAVMMRPVTHFPSRASRYESSPYALAFETTENPWRKSSMDGKRVCYTTMNSAEEVGWTQTSIETVSPRYASFQRARSEALVTQPKPTKASGMRQQFTELIDLVKKPEILYPLSWFMASYAMIPTLAGTMFFFQTEHLKIDPSVVGMAKVMGQVGLMGGSALYSRYLKGMPLRKLLGSIQVLLCMCMMFDILLVKRVNVWLGIPDEVLVLGASAFVDAINQFKILPFAVLLAQLCPAGSEGSLLAAFMSVQCLATIISGYMGVSLASMLHITCDDFSELPTGIVVQSLAALLPLLWISLLPDEPGGGKRKQDGKKTQ